MIAYLYKKNNFMAKIKVSKLLHAKIGQALLESELNYI
jgi:hypothetical protein